VFGSGTTGTSGSTPATDGLSSAAGEFVGGPFVDGDDDEVEVEATPGKSSMLGSRLSFLADCFLLREKGIRDAFGVLAFRRAGSAAAGSSSGCINWGKRAFEEDEAEVSAIVV
jgi:hypothetical protein